LPWVSGLRSTGKCLFIIISGREYCSSHNNNLHYHCSSHTNNFHYYINLYRANTFLGPVLDSSSGLLCVGAEKVLLHRLSFASNIYLVRHIFFRIYVPP
jgi:hypothetical protein